MAGDETGFDLLSPSSSSTSLPCLKFAAMTNPSLHHHSVRLRMWSSFRSSGLGPIICSRVSHLFLSVAPIFAISLRGPATKMSSPCTVPATEQDSLQKQQPDTAPTVRQQLTSPFLNSSLHDAAAGRVPSNFGPTFRTERRHSQRELARS